MKGPQAFLKYRTAQRSSTGEVLCTNVLGDFIQLGEVRGYHAIELCRSLSGRRIVQESQDASTLGELVIVQ